MYYTYDAVTFALLAVSNIASVVAISEGRIGADITSYLMMYTGIIAAGGGLSMTIIEMDILKAVVKSEESQ